MHSSLTKQLADDHIRELRRSALVLRIAPLQRRHTRQAR
jgi:hypothetical protein